VLRAIRHAARHSVLLRVKHFAQPQFVVARKTALVQLSN
jgi:hypothetical protein